MVESFTSSPTSPHTPPSVVLAALDSLNCEDTLRWYENSHGDQPRRRVGSTAPAISGRFSPGYILDSMDSSAGPDPKVGSHRAKVRLWEKFTWWWWWEIGSLFINVVSLTILVGVLAGYQHHALSNWHFPLQPNSVISILATIMKTTVLLSVSACLGQLKWHHFSTPRQLSDLEAFDEASRGPWGSFLFLLQCHRWFLLATGLAIITLVSLLIGPAAQQILDFQSSEAILEGTDAKIASSHNFKLRVSADSQDADYTNTLGRGSTLINNTAALSIRSTLVNAMIGNISPFSFSCPDSAVKCLYPKFTTGAISCDISWPSIWDEIKEVQPITMRLNHTDQDRGQVEFWSSYPKDQAAWDDLFSLKTSMASLESTRGPFLYINGVKSPPQRLNELDKLKFEGFEGIWYWCAQTYNVSSGSPKGVSPQLISTSPLNPIEPNCWSSNPEVCAYSDNLTSGVYHLDNYSAWWLDHYIDSALASTVSILRSPGGESYGQSGISLDIGVFLYSAPDLETVFQNLATQASRIIRINGGENINTTTVNGIAFRSETFIDVRWGWVLLPAIETFLAVILLVATIVVTHKSQQPLLKSSVNSLLFHGLEGWTATDTAGQVDGKETLAALEDISRDLEVRFQGSERAGYRFIRM
ncbi:hypothetical protein F5Y09DRAFT_351077 [Xylaria sp. FL1042]|nr:hypothetical protein F5Y09DRAFT_351077 [Xylaria sp. FL1042]